jgi:thiamine transport system permease protein
LSAETEAGRNTRSAAIPRWLRLGLLWALPLAFLAGLYFYPMANILRVSFARGEAGLAAPFLGLLRSPSFVHILAFTVFQAILSTVLTLLLGLPGAYVFARYKFRGKSLLRALTGIPFVMPTLVVAAAFYSLLGPRGWLNLALMDLLHLAAPPIQFTGTLAAILVAHVFYNTTIVLRMVGDFWSRLDPRMTAAAQVLGANRWQALARVVAPLLSPAIITAALLVFIFDFSSFGVILVLGGPRFATLEVDIYYQTVSLFNLPAAAALSVIQLLCTLGLTVAYTRLSARVSRPIELRPRRFTEHALTTPSRRLIAGVVVSLLLSMLTLPLLSLIARSLIPLGAQQSILESLLSGPSLRFYEQLTQNPQSSVFYVPPSTAIAVSLSYAVMTVLLSLIIGLPASWALAGEPRSTLNRILDPLLMLPLGTSAVTLGLGFIVSLGSGALKLRSSPVLVPLAHTLVAFPFVVRSLTPSLRSIRPRLRDAAAVLGAGPRQVLRYIDLPLVGRAILVAAIFAFAVSMGEFGATALLARPEYPTVPIMIYRFLSRPGALNYGQALALSTILMLITGLGMLGIERFRIAEVGEF